MRTLKERDKELEQMWSEFADVPFDPDKEVIEDDFYDFPHGTKREEIWKWFDQRYSKGVAALLYGDGVDRTADIAELMYHKSLCGACDSADCVFYHERFCRYPMICGTKPTITEEEGCTNYMYTAAQYFVG